MRITPENSILQKEFEGELDYVKVWDDEFPVVRGDNIKARHINALWAALTERGRLVGLQVHDWTIGDVEPGSGSAGGSSGLGSEGNEWEFPVNGAVRPDDEIYWDGFKNQDDTDAIEATAIQGSNIQDLLTSINLVCQRYANPDEGRGFLGLGDLMGYLMIGKLEEGNEETFWPFDQFSGTDHEYEAWSFPTVPDRTEEAREARQEQIEEDHAAEVASAEEFGEDPPDPLPNLTPFQQEEADNAAASDRLWYERFNPTPSNKFERQTIRINDPRFIDGGGGFGEAQYTLWDFFSPITTSIPETIQVKISSNPLGEDPKDDDEAASVPLTGFHEHINAVYYMIRALEWLPFKTSDDPPDHKEITIGNDGIRLDIVSPIVCEFFQLPSKAFIEEWTAFVVQRLSLPHSIVFTSAGTSATLFAQATQETWYQCPFSGPIGNRLWTAQNTKESRFAAYVPLNKPWDSDYEQDEFPGGFATPRYTSDEIKLWHDGSTNTSQGTADGSGPTEDGWGGDALLMLEEGEVGDLTGDNNIVSGEQIDKIEATVNNTFETSKQLKITTKMPETVAELEASNEFGVPNPSFNLHYNLDPGKFAKVNPPNNITPKVQSSDSITGKNFTDSVIIDDVMVAVRFSDHTYPGGRVDFADMEL